MSAYGPGMDTILLELEAAIKNSYMAEFEDFIKAEVSTNSVLYSFIFHQFLRV